jgi:hypothetical protein
MMTIFSFLNGCTNLSIVSLGKDDFINGCVTENLIENRQSCGSGKSEIQSRELNGFVSCEQSLSSASSTYHCKQLWEDSVIWCAISTMMDLLINIRVFHCLMGKIL